MPYINRVTKFETTTNFLGTGVRAIKIPDRRTLSMPAIRELVQRVYPGTNENCIEVHFQPDEATGREVFWVVIVPL